MNFASDNWAGATASVMEAIARANGGFAPAYSGDPLSRSVHETFSDIFEREVEVHFMATGTAANTLSMSLCARPGGFVVCTEQAHILGDEYNATEAFTGMKLVPVPTEDGRMTVAGLEAAFARLPPAGHGGPAAALSLTNASELGTVYEPDEIAALAVAAKARGMLVHVDGARFANAVAASGATPAALTWRCGVDLMSFGGTKNGCWAAEAVVIFEPGRFPDAATLRQRAGQGMSKARFVAAQYEGYFAGGAWLRTAAHANAMAARLAAGLKRSNAAQLPLAGTANELFPVMSKALTARLRAAGAVFHSWQDAEPGHEMVRLVTSFATTEADVDRFLALVEGGAVG